MPIKRIFTLLTVVILFQIHPVLSQTTNREVLTAGDAVNIQIWQMFDNVSGRSPISNLSGEYVIDTRGFIFMPFVGLVRVANKRPQDVEVLIKEKYKSYLTEPFIYVRPLIRVTLIGAVSRPGSYRVDPQNSFWDLMDNAGGPASTADLRKMFVVRGGVKSIENLLQAFENAHSLYEVGIKSGDQIVVPPRSTFNLNTILNYASFAASIALLYMRLQDRRN